MAHKLKSGDYLNRKKPTKKIKKKKIKKTKPPRK